MVDISIETEEQTDIRLRSIISNADFETYEGYYVFEEFPLSEFNTNVDPNSLALVRDNEVWSQLVRANDSSKELFTLFSFHFDNGTDNSGFVGWLASLLKRELGTGVFVTCGQNTNRGGIFDYWGCPAALGEKAIQTVRDLIETNA
tara:strand:- start:49 stop:486 length:438 start_codon:yes stop_codon:yes gene_type:complete